MKISIKDVKNEIFYPELKRIGFNGVDISFSHWAQKDYILSQEFEQSILMKYKMIRTAGLEVCQTHLTYYPGHLKPIGDGSYKDFEEYLLPIILREIELTAKLDCTVAVIHLYFDVSREKSQTGNLTLIEKLLPVLEKNQVSLAIENIYGPNYGDAHLSTSNDLLYYTEYFKNNYLGICLDAGHAITRKQDPVEMLRRLNLNIKALHLHSNLVERDLHLPPCFTDTVDWQEFSSALFDIGYCGSFNMEITAPKQMNDRTALSYYEMVYGIADNLIHRSS